MKSAHCSLPFMFPLLQIMERALFHMDNCYKIPNIRGTGRLCKTNLPSNTAFRGFGGPQGMLIAEYWMSEVAVTCGMPAEEVSGVFGSTSQSGLDYLGGESLCILGISHGGCPHLHHFLPPTRPLYLSLWEGAEEKPVQRRGPHTLQPEA